MGNILFIIYLVFLVAALYALWRWISNLLKRLNLSPEKRPLLAIIAVSIAAFLGMMLGLKLNSRLQASDTTPSAVAQAQRQNQQNQQNQNEQAVPEADKTSRADASTEVIAAPSSTGGAAAARQELTDEQKLLLYVETYQPTLYEQRSGLKSAIKKLENSFRQLNELAKQAPKQRRMLAGIAEIRQQSYRRLRRLLTELDEQLLNFWVHFNTGNQSDAEKKFDQQAKQLAEKIRQMRGDLLDNDRREEKLVSAYLNRVGNALKNNQLPSTSAGITAYSTANRERLQEWAQFNMSTELSANLAQLRDRRSRIIQRRQQLETYIRQYPKLRQALERTHHLWTVALQQNLYAEYRLLQVVEIEYLQEEMNTGLASEARQQLDRDLRTYMPGMINAVEKHLINAEEAYRPDNLQ